jgi:hypothetical protein
MSKSRVKDKFGDRIADNRSPRDALRRCTDPSYCLPKVAVKRSILLSRQLSVHIFQPLGLFNVHKECLSRLVSNRVLILQKRLDNIPPVLSTQELVHSVS